ncbi:MAG TPA: hypothetical protein PKH07_04770, partial [bacterium]|nr:hypothetical protein [bacterium]
ERYLQQAEEVLRTYSDEIWGVFTGDEITHYQTYGLIKAVSEQSSLHPYAQAIDRDVRDRFGLGQYGVPRSVEDQEPYRWMAVEKWIDDQVCLLTKDLRKVVDRVAPQMLLVSDDPEAGFHGHDYARRGKWCDIVTHQTYPSRSPMRQEVGFITKMLFDLSGKSVWPCVHAENYGASYSPEETAEVYSQVFRCGGDGIHYYPDDVQGTRRNILDTHYCRIGAPDRWATMQAIFERVRDLPRLKLPRKTRTAIFIEPSTYQATLPTKRGQHLEYEMCFSFLGPNARSWFQFVHAGQVARNEVKLSQHRTVFLPMAKFFDPEMAQSLIEFCKKGGTVICGDPEVFRYSTQQAYQPVPALNELGWKCSDKTSPVDCIRILRNDLWRNIPNGTTISFPNPLQAFVIEPRDSFETLAHFDTGTPAIVCRKLGKGNWVQFAFQPFTYECLCNETMRTLFRSILERQGEKTGLDIWRFTFPVAESPKPPKGQCLTGNACVWEMNVPRNVGGSGIPITVRWTTPPQGVNEKTVSSDACRLFDRRKALTAQNDRQISSALENWTYIWETQNSFNVELELNATHTLDRLQVWFSGALPKADVLIHTKGDVWSRLGAFDAMDVGEDVAMITVSLENAEADCVRIVFAPSSDSNRFSLCELEVWAPSK